MWWGHCVECDHCQFVESWVVFVTVSVLYGATEGASGDRRLIAARGEPGNQTQVVG
jgi:hypothetical protein